MANYKVNEKSKTISVSGALTEIERAIISTYILNGYKVKEKRVSNAARIGDEDITKYLKEQKDEKGEITKEAKAILDAYEAEKAKKIKDAKGKERKAGYLVALKWFKAEHYDIYDKLMEAVENNPEKTAKRRAAKKEADEEAAKAKAKAAAKE